MRTIKYIFIAFALVLAVSSCDSPENIDPKSPTEVPASSLFTNAQIALVNQVNSTSVNSNISRLLAQYWMETTYTSESRYNFQDRGIPDSYADNFYRNSLMDFQEAKSLLEEPKGDESVAQTAERINKLAIIDVMEVYAYHCLVDAFGDTPYSEALMGASNSTPKYDNAQSIYLDLIARLSNSISKMDDSVGSFGEFDLVYEGDVALWKKFAASLKLRLGMRIADVLPAESQAAVEEAVASGVYEAQSESGYFKYVGVEPHVNSIYAAFFVSARKDFTPANTYIDKLLDLNDPRLAYQFTKVTIDTTDNDIDDPVSIYRGIPYGRSGGGAYNSYSHFSDRFFDPTFEVTLVDYSEVEFLLAEAVERGYSVVGTAATHYEAGIRANMEYLEATDDEITTYLAQPEVDYATATGDYKQKIGEQKWIALYNRGVEAWAEWRRLDYPILNVPEEMTYEDIPLRMPYPFDEGELNPDNYAAAAAAIGGDKTSTRIFWDKF